MSHVSGKSDTALNVGLDDLLKADSHGKWYLVGSAWRGVDSTKSETATSGKCLHIIVSCLTGYMTCC